MEIPQLNYGIFPDKMEKTEEDEFQKMPDSIEIISIFFWTNILKNKKKEKIFSMRVCIVISLMMGIVPKIKENTSLAAPGAPAHLLQRRTACKTKNGR